MEHTTLVVRGHPVVRSREAGDGVMYHGGMIRLKAPDGELTERDITRNNDEIRRIIEYGLALLENEEDLTIEAHTKVQLINSYDLVSNDYILMWRIACRYRQATGRARPERQI